MAASAARSCCIPKTCAAFTVATNRPSSRDRARWRRRAFMADAAWDAIVVGSGAGGSAVAWRLVRAGKRVLLVEKGSALPRDGSTLDVARVIHEGAFKSHEQWRRADGRHVVPEEYFNI